MKVIVGLGNPGPKYSRTRHNVGWMAADLLGRRWGIRKDRDLCSCRVGAGRFEGCPVRLVLPQTYMNGSGAAVARLLKRLKQGPSSLLVVLDDVSLPLGLIRLKGKGSSGGHLGLASVLEDLQTEEVPRLRVGIGRSSPSQRGPAEKNDLTDFVLGRFDPDEQGLLDTVLSEAAHACEAWVVGGLPAAMNRFNRNRSAP